MSLTIDGTAGIRPKRGLGIRISPRSVLHPGGGADPSTGESAIDGPGPVFSRKAVERHRGCPQAVSVMRLTPTTPGGREDRSR
jgi:hypothetical protein